MAISTDDYVAIQDLLGNYCWLVDEGDESGWTALWTEDGTFIGFGPQPPKSFNPMRTRAKPEVWNEKAEFDAIFTNKMVPAAAKMVDVAAGGDIAAIKVQVEELGKVCTECHTKFRYEQDE